MRIQTDVKEYTQFNFNAIRPDEEISISRSTLEKVTNGSNQVVSDIVNDFITHTEQSVRQLVNKL